MLYWLADAFTCSKSSNSTTEEESYQQLAYFTTTNVSFHAYRRISGFRRCMGAPPTPPLRPNLFLFGQIPNMLAPPPIIVWEILDPPLLRRSLKFKSKHLQSFCQQLVIEVLFLNLLAYPPWCPTVDSFIIIITVLNSSCGKVMSSQVCVKNSVHRRACAWQVGVCGGGGAWQERQSLQRTVGILLECILFINFLGCGDRLQDVLATLPNDRFSNILDTLI